MKMGNRRKLECVEVMLCLNIEMKRTALCFGSYYEAFQSNKSTSEKLLRVMRSSSHFLFQVETIAADHSQPILPDHAATRVVINWNQCEDCGGK